MKLAHSLALLGMSTALAGTQAMAADYFVQAITPGAVTGTPLAVITLQAGGDAADPADAPVLNLKATTSERIRTKETSTGERAGKWLSARKGKSSEGVTEGSSGGETGTDVPVETSGGTPAGDGTGDAGAETASEGAARLTSATEAGATTEGGSTTDGTTEGGMTEGGTTGGTTEGGTTGGGTGGGTTEGGTTGGNTGGGTTPPPTTTPGTSTGGGVVLTAPPSTTGVPVPAGAQIWKNFDSLMKSGKVAGGDRIFLLSGYHGQIMVRDQKFGSMVTIAPAAGEVAHADSIVVMNSSNVHVQGLKVWPRSPNSGTAALVRSYSNTSNIAFTDLDVRGTATAGNYSSWSVSDWNNYRTTGFLADGAGATVARSRVTGVFNGIAIIGKNSLMEDNIVDGFSGDGMRALGDNSIVRHNKVQNCHQVNGSHTDGFQAWSIGAGGKIGAGTLSNVTIEDNKILEFVGTRSPIACKLQGISLFNGVYDNFVIRNNVISSTAYHGIAIAGGQNSQIVNNTVIHAFGTAGSYPWIRVSGNRDGRPSLNTVVANNMTTSLKVKSDPTKKIAETNNVVVTNASGEFAAVSKQDFNLRSGSKGVDAGAPTLAPKDDIVGAARPKGKAPDAGAYENF